MSNKFFRQDTVRHLRLGKKRPKLQKWRRPRGRHSKIRKKRFSYPKKPSIGYRTSKKETGKIMGKIPVVIENLKQLESCTKEHIIILARRVGARKKLELIKRAKDKNLNLLNVRENQHETK